MLGCDARAARRAARGRASVRGLSAARRQARSRSARISLAFGIVLVLIVMVVIVGSAFLPLMFSAARSRPRASHGHARADAAGRARDHGCEPSACTMAMLFAAPLIVLARLGRRAGAEDELRRVPEEHPAVPRLEHRDLRSGHSRVDSVVPRLAAARSRADGVAVSWRIATSFTRCEEIACGGDAR